MGDRHRDVIPEDLLSASIQLRVEAISSEGLNFNGNWRGEELRTQLLLGLFEAGNRVGNGFVQLEVLGFGRRARSMVAREPGGLEPIVRITEVGVDSVAGEERKQSVTEIGVEKPFPMF